MRVEQLDLIAYGHYSETTLDLGQPRRGLTVVWGPNEAGKSTARRALLAALFGFERHSPDAHRYGPHGMRLGIRISSADGTDLSFVRQGLSRVTLVDGAPVDEEVIARSCGGIEREHYTRLFSIGHDELRTGSESLLAAEGEIGRLLYGASLGLSVTAVLRRLDERAGRLFQARGRAQRVPKALAAYRATMQRARAAQVRTAEWDRRRQAVDDAERQLQRVRTEFGEARGEQARLIRIQSARPLLARRAEALERLEALGQVASERWAGHAREALDVYRERQRAHASALSVRDRLVREVEALVVPDALLERSELIDRLVEGIDRYDKDTVDLPKRRAELEGVGSRVAAYLRVLGQATDGGRPVAEADLVMVETLAQGHAELVTEGRATRAELDKVRLQLAAAERRLAAMAEPPDVHALDRALRLAHPKVEVARTLVAGRADQARAADDLAAQASRLGLGALGRDRIPALPVPTAVEVDIERDRRESHRLQMAQLAREQAAAATAVEGIEEEIATLGRAVPDPGRLGAARAHRDAGWQAVRQALQGEPATSVWPAGGPLADAYEAAVVEADLAADERYDHAGALAALAQLRDRLVDLAAQKHQLGQRASELVAADSAAGRRWEQRWASIGVEGRPPEAMAEWLRGQRDLVAAIGAWHQSETKLVVEEEEIERRRSGLASALAACGRQPCSPELDRLVAQAEEVVAEAGAMSEARRLVETEIQLSQEAILQRKLALERHEEDLAGWQRRWAAVLRPLSLAPSVEPPAATLAVAAHRGLAVARDEAAALSDRIEGIERDRRAYVGRVADAAAGILQAAAGEPLQMVSELQRRLTAARAGHQRRETLAGELEQAKGAVAQVESLLEDARRVLISVRAEGGMEPSDDDPDADVEAAVGRALEAARYHQKMLDAETVLLEQGDGRTIDEIVTEAAAAGDSLARDIVTTTADVDALQVKLEDATARLADTQRSIDAVTDAATAADIEQEAQSELALASELATEYARTALAAEVLRRTIADYSDHHRGPLLDRAGALFERLTGGAFTELVPDADGDRQILLARRQGGDLCTALMLSDGTRDQLYLALRLAGIEHQLDTIPDPLPVVLDDVLVHFDDGRAAAAVCAVGELARRTQVLLFTHHERVVEIARHQVAADALAVVQLRPRDHDQAPTSVGTSQMRPAAASLDGQSERHAAKREILAAASRAGEALTKAELLERSGVPESHWPAAIRSLVESGALVQQGQKRGARYRNPGRQS